MSERFHLLPEASAAKFERALSESMDRMPELAVGVKNLRGFKFEPNDRIVPYLVFEYGLTEIEDYLPDLRTVLREGIAWQRIIGTPSAIHKALSWIRHDGDIEEFPAKARKWWWFQIHLPSEPRNADFVRPMTHLVKASKPLRSEFARVTAGWDVRAFRLNKHRLNGGAGLNNWSGRQRAPGEPVLSLRVNQRRQVIIPTGGIVGIREAHCIFTVRKVSVNIPLYQPSARIAAMAAARVDINDPATVAFQNAPFIDKPFGSPVPRIQKGLD